MEVWLIIGVMIAALVAMFFWLQRLQKKLKQACYIERTEDALLFKDFEGKVINEDLIIKIK